jgi:hypothetical protein
MTCYVLPSKHGTIIACARPRQRDRKCRFCGEWGAALLCDYPVKRGKTCDQVMCARCAVKQPARHIDGDSVDFCPPHARAAAEPKQEELDL